MLIFLKSLLDRVLDTNLRGRDRDRAIQWSLALEFFDQVSCVIVGNAFHLELEAYGVEH